MMKKKTMPKISVLTGAGISAESGIKTFRDAGGLWEGYRIEDVATPEAWKRNPGQVLDFYNERRRQLLTRYEVTVITQNVDDLHERAGSRHVLHLHGELLKARSSLYEELIYPWKKDIHLGDLCEKGGQLRPHIVWFGESVPMMEQAVEDIANADIVMVIGSSMQVYPAAGLVAYAPADAVMYYIDPNPSINYELNHHRSLEIIPKVASVGVREVVDKLLI